MVNPLPTSLPEPHRRFLAASLDALARDARIVGIAAGGSILTNSMDEFSDLDLVVATEPQVHGEVMGDRSRIAGTLGPLVAAFTGEHVGEPRLLICLYQGTPPLRVDLKFVSPLDLSERVEDPVVLWERGERLTGALAAGNAEYPMPDRQWIEDRFWVWVHHVTAKLARGELFEALDSLAFLRAKVLGPLAVVAAGARPAGARRVFRFLFVFAFLLASGGWLACAGRADQGAPGGEGQPAAGGRAMGGAASGGAGGTGGIPENVHVIDVALQCPQFTACGGDLVGAWRLQSACGFDGTLHLPEPCAGVTSWLQGTDASTLVFGADRIATAHDENLATSAGAFNDTCARAVAGVNAEQFCAGEGRIGGPLECTYTNQICTCINGRYLVYASWSYPYTVTGAELEIEGQKQDFCVQGDTLTLRVTSGAGGAGGGTVTGRVLRRQ